MAFKFYKSSRNTYWSTLIEDLFNKKPKPVVSFKDIEEIVAHLNTKDPVWVRIVDKIQDIAMFPSDLYHSVRIYIKNSKGNTHVLDGGLEKGQWYDLDYRISRCLFNELDKFITQEKGFQTHEWEKTLVYNDSWDEGTERYGQLTNQAKAAIEQDFIWKWWLENKDVEIDLGMESDYREQETQMLIRLIKIRHSLWT